MAALLKIDGARLSRAHAPGGAAQKLGAQLLLELADAAP
jgi:hypothetical protein